MQEKQAYEQTVLSIYIFARGIGFVFFESPLAPYDWGTKEIRGENAGRNMVRVVTRLIKQYRPDQVVLEDTEATDTRRGPRARLLNQQIRNAVLGLGQQPNLISRPDIRLAFARTGAQTKDAIAKMIASKIDAFAPLLPPTRKPWDPEHRRMALFDAASMGLTYYVR
ncbi:MAG: hypothetical protein JWM26_3768 [Betaproteobacteria bacterium]|nr:hypothetical protein [Betaproteobacteria bacterium]